MKHLKYGGSTAARTIQCAAWPNLAQSLPTPPTSSFAEEGTMLHDAAEATMKGLKDPTANISPELQHSKLQPAMEAAYKVMADLNISEYRTEPFLELVPDQAGGSIDLLGLSEDGTTLMVLDYKFGHYRVTAEDNAQLLFYALCAMTDDVHGLDIDRVNTLALVIIQPQDGECEPDIWMTPESTLNDFEDLIYDAIDRAEISPLEGYQATAGPACRFCPAEAICTVKTGAAAAALRCTPAQVAEVAAALPLLSQLESWIKAVRKLAHEQAEQGQQLTGWKLVNKRARRVWNDPLKAAEKIRRARGIAIKDAQDIELKSPTQVEKLFKEKGVDFGKMSDYISSVSSGTTIAPEKDNREAVIPIAALKLTLDQL